MSSNRSGHDSLAVMIPRAKVKHTNSGHSRQPRGGYHSDDDCMTQDEANQGTSERLSMGSRHRRRSVPSFSSG